MWMHFRCTRTSRARARPGGHARRTMVIRMTLPTTGPLFWHCGAHTAEPKIGLIRPILPIPYYQKMLFSVARGCSHKGGRASARQENDRRGEGSQGSVSKKEGVITREGSHGTKLTGLACLVVGTGRQVIESALS